MISVTEAIDLIKSNVSVLPPVIIPLSNALGLVLAQDVFAQASVPPFHQSAMDGYAFRYDDYLQKREFFLVGEVAAGGKAEPLCVPGGAVRIFTGAPLPLWADTVVMQEKTNLIDNRLHVGDAELLKGSNMRTEGADIGEGELALQKGTTLTPAGIGFLAGVGTTEVFVHPKPVVHIIVTGNELQSPGKPLQPGQIYESNSVMLQTALQQFGVTSSCVQSITDDIVMLQAALNKALDNADLVLLTGGVSVGDYDFVVQAAEACGVVRLFHKVAQRPGKPLYAGTKNGKLLFGLPGNPASVLTCFYVYVTAALEAFTGRSLVQKQTLLLASPVSKKIWLTQFLKATYRGGEVTPITAQESFRLSSFSVANCLLILPADTLDFAEGEPVETILLPYL